MSLRAPRPPRVSGTLAPRARDVLRLVWWAQRGYLHGVRGGRGTGRWFSVVLAVPLAVPVQAGLMLRRRARYYMAPGRDAVLAVVATDRGWYIEDHAASGRARVLPVLAAAADKAGITMYTTAATARHRPKWEQALEMIDELATWGHLPPLVVLPTPATETTEPSAPG